VLCCVVLCCVVLCCVVLWCAVLCCVVLRCAALRCLAAVGLGVWQRLENSFDEILLRLTDMNLLTPQNVRRSHSF
jgi:hypothetical protein